MPKPLQFLDLKDKREKISRVIKPTILIAFAMIFSIVGYAIIGKFVTLDLGISIPVVEKLYTVFNGISVGLIVIILGLRRRLYLSDRIIKKNLDLDSLLQKWRTIDIIFFAMAEICAILGLAVTLMGMPFNRTFHFFVVAIILILILLPMEMKISQRLAAIENKTKNIC